MLRTCILSLRGHVAVLSRIRVNLCFICGFFLSTAAAWAQLPATHTIALGEHNFTLPEGFTIERVAATPLIDRPVHIDFDELGRLYATEMDGAITKPDVAAQKAMHRVLRLEDPDGDGKFDKRTVFADQLPFPEGAMWYAGSLYVAAPPKIWKFTDTDGDGTADKREVWFDAKTLTGCANDLHGPYLGPDGWIYWCKGAFAEQTYTLPNGREFKTRASHIFRARPDGTGIEPVMTGGMDNPVDVVFTPGGERIFTTTFLQRPAGGNRDGLIHAVYGGIYGKDHDVVYDPVHKWTSPDFMPVLTHMGPAAPCGLHRLESDQFGREFQDNLFACQFNLRKISRHVLRPSGSTFTTEDSDFLVSDNTDFHPTDVIEDADGSLLVVDTGGWYKLCCPSSQLVKEDVLGAIYRVKKGGSHNVADPRGSKIEFAKSTPADLAALLGDERPAVQRQAIERLAALGKAGVEPLSPILANPKSPPIAARAAISAAARVDDNLARRLIHEAMRHEDESVVQLAVHIASVNRDATAAAQLTRLLEPRRSRARGKTQTANAQSLHNRRAAAEALGRIGERRSAQLVLESAFADKECDRCLEHSLTYALIEMSNPDLTIGGTLQAQRAALMAMEQVGAKLTPEFVIACLDNPDQQLRDRARWVASRHPEWGAALSAHLFQRLTGRQHTLAEQTELAGLLAKLAKGPEIRTLIAEASEDISPEVAKVGLAAMANAGEKELPKAWLTVLAARLAPDSPVLLQALNVARQVPPAKSDADKLAAALTKLADSEGSTEIRLTALSAVPGGLKEVTAKQLELLLAQIDREQPPELRGLASEAISKAKLSPEQLQQLAARLPRAAPMELDRLLTPFAQSTDAEAGLALIEVLHAPELRAAVTVDSVRQRVAKYPPAVLAAAEKLYAEIDAELATQRSRLEETLAQLPPGDIRRGQTIFNSSKLSCRACHTIGYVGGKIGPDMTRIGQIRQPRDLVESILFPSASFVRSYEPVAVRTLDGQVYSGVVKVDSPVEVILTLAADKEVRLAREDIEIAQPGKVSIMPAGLDKQLSLQELADLVEFLRNCK
jgi:putative membrane-bound dehydrogenase-like protein